MGTAPRQRRHGLRRARTVAHRVLHAQHHRDLRQLNDDLTLLTGRVEACIDQHVRRGEPAIRHTATPDRVELLVIDEAEWFSLAALEHLRDRFDRRRYGLLLIGMPGIEKGLSRYPQLYSRIGFAHQYRSLGDDELAFVLTRHWKRLGLALDLSDFTDAQAVAAVGRDIPARAAASTASAIGPPSWCAAHRGLLRHSTRMS